MPSRLGVGLIVLFWLATTGFLFDRDVLPRLRSDAPPAFRIDLADEATQTVPVRWTVWRGDTPVGTLNTKMEYRESDDTFAFVSQYRGLRVEFDATQLKLRCDIPDLRLTVRVGRAGDLREQDMAGTLAGTALVGPVPLGELTADATLTSRVVNGELVGRCVLKSPLGDLDRPLDPVPVPAGQVLNPLQPVNRLQDVRPGRRWLVYEVNPVRDSLFQMVQGVLKEQAKSTLLSLPPPGREPLIAEVRAEPEDLVRRKGEPHPCWVIEYRGEKATARTWVSVADGRVLRQEASGQGEALRLDREE